LDLLTRLTRLGPLDLSRLQRLQRPLDLLDLLDLSRLQRLQRPLDLLDLSLRLFPLDLWVRGLSDLLCLSDPWVLSSLYCPWVLLIPLRLAYLLDRSVRSILSGLSVR
jgi:hypothetical protein